MTGFLRIALLSVACALPGTAFAQSRAYDGHWSLSLVTLRGDCSPHSFHVHINDGVVILPMMISGTGRVTPIGFVTMTISALGRKASGTGRLAKASGGGRWVEVATGQKCAGRWTAARWSTS